MTRTCKMCGAALQEHASRGRPREWCSQACYQKERRRRQASPPPKRLCGHCGVVIEGRSLSARFCSSQCSYASRGIRLYAHLQPARPCVVCGEAFQPTRHPEARFCSKRCRDRRPRDRPRVRRYTDADRARDQRKQALRRGAATGRPVVLCEIGDRDGWQCELCGNPVDRWLEYPDPLSSSLDHILPVSLGGIHDPSNVRVTHLRCNIRRGNRIDEVAEVS